MAVKTKKVSNYAKTKAKVAAGRHHHTGNPLTFVATTIKEVQASYDRLETQEEQEAYLDEFSLALEKSTPQGWAGVYHGLEMLRKATWYWKAKGYKTFKDFLRSETAFTFSQLEKLESRYHFAATACPKLFNMSAKDADELVERLRKAEAVAKNGVRGKGKKSFDQKKSDKSFSPLAELDVESQSEEFQRGYKSHGGTSHFYRFGRLKRDCPPIAQKILDGEYTRERANGNMYIDLNSAEVDAERRTKGKFKAKPRPSTKKTPSQKAIHALKALSADEWNEVVTWMNQQN